MKKVLGFLLAVGVMVGVVSFSGVMSGEAYAAQCSGGSFLGMKPWYEGLECGDDNSPRPSKTEEGMSTFVWTIVGNVAFDLLLIVGIIATGYVIYAGYAYMTSGGDPGKAMKARKSLVASIAGILVSIVASSAIDIILAATITADIKSNDPASALKGIFNLATSFGGIIATGFAILGGIMYMTSAGDPGKVRKAKQTLLYAIIGLAVVVASYSIVNFVIVSA